MNRNIEIRESLPADVAAIEKLYPAAFPDEDLVPLVRELLSEQTSVLSLVGVLDQALTGHVIFTTCGIAGHPDPVSLLGPVAVAPARQKRGIGGALIREGFQRLEKAGVTLVLVLGDPAYYGRFGFEPETGITPPYPFPDPLPEEWRGAWQSVRLGKAARPSGGTLSVPRPWRQPALWAP